MISLCGCSHFTKYTFVDAALKKDFGYEVGTYWVMKDSASGRTDSFYVADYAVVHAVDHTYLDYTDGEQITISIIQKSLTPGFDADSFSYKFFLWKSGFLLSYSHPNAHSANGLYSLSGDKIEYSPPFYYPFSTMRGTSYQGSIGSNHDTTAIGYISHSMAPIPTTVVLVMNGQTFTDVIGINYTHHIKYNTAETYDYNDHYLFNADAGIVQIRQYHPQDSMDRNWQLVRWHYEH